MKRWLKLLGAAALNGALGATAGVAVTDSNSPTQFKAIGGMGLAGAILGVANLLTQSPVAKKKNFTPEEVTEIVRLNTPPASVNGQ